MNNIIDRRITNTCLMVFLLSTFCSIPLFIEGVLFTQIAFLFMMTTGMTNALILFLSMEEK